MPKPERCGKCGAVAELRKKCVKCGESVWVLRHAEHYMEGSREIVPCRCSKSGSKEAERARWQKKKARITRDTGKIFTTGKFRPVTTPAMANKAAEGLARGLSPTQALREAGYPPATVRHAKAGINKMIRAELKTMGRKYIEMGRGLSPEDQELLVRGMLFENVLLKTDKGVLAAKQLGADKRVSMWTADSQVGLVVLQPPAIPTVNHQVKILPPIERKQEPKT